MHTTQMTVGPCFINFRMHTLLSVCNVSCIYNWHWSIVFLLTTTILPSKLSEWTSYRIWISYRMIIWYMFSICKNQIDKKTSNYSQTETCYKEFSTPVNIGGKIMSQKNIKIWWNFKTKTFQLKLYWTIYFPNLNLLC